MAETDREDIRRRVVEWDDPQKNVDAAPGLSGIEFLRAMAAGELPPPPIGNLVGMTLAEVGEGTATFTCEPGVVHGGLISTLRCVGRVVKPGRRVAFAEAELTDGRGALVATATSSLLVFPF